MKQIYRISRFLSGLFKKKKHPVKKNRIKFNAKLTIKAVIKTEQLLNKSFGQIDYANETDLKTLLYCMVLTNNDILFSYAEFQHLMANDKMLKDILSEFERESKVLSQFQNKEKQDGTGNREGGTGKISDIISTLIMSGLDAHYAMNEMNLCDLPLFIAAYERKTKEQMESSRLWTYLGMLPHIDAKKLKNGAQDIYPFPWEMEEMKKEAEKAIQEDSGKLEMFFEQGKNLIKKNYGG